RTGTVVASQELTFSKGIRPVWSPDSSVLGLSTGDGQFLLMDARSGKLRRLFGVAEGQRRLFLPMSFSPDGTRVAVVRGVGDLAQVTVFDVASGRQISSPAAQAGWTLSSIAWSPNGKVLALAARDPRAGAGLSSISLVDPQSGESIDQTGPIASTSLQQIAFADGGRRIVSVGFGRTSATGGGTVRFWDVDMLLPIGDPVPLAEGVSGLWVSRNGSYALQLQLGGDPQAPSPAGVMVWAGTSTAGLRMACDPAGRPSPRAEWRKPLPERPYTPACRS